MQDHSALSGQYERLWHEGRVALSTGRIDVDPLPVDGGSRWGISAVLRPGPWSAPLLRSAGEVAALATSAVVYAPDHLHITIQQFEEHRSAVPADDPALHDLTRTLASVAHELPRLELGLRGLAATSGGIIVQGWPSFEMQSMRGRLHRELAATRSPVRGPEAAASALRTSAHATLAIFRGPVARAEELVAYIDAHRDTDFGTIRFEELWLVGYARTERSVRLIEYGRFPVGGSAGSSR